jgi:hypothetical protein
MFNTMSCSLLFLFLFVGDTGPQGFQGIPGIQGIQGKLTTKLICVDIICLCTLCAIFFVTFVFNFGYLFVFR